MRKKLFIILGIFLLVALQIGLNSAICCEKLESNGAWCQNAVEMTECSSDFDVKITSCEQTSMCELGVCWDTLEGTCDVQVSNRVCNDAGGVWSSKPIEELPQCNIGCCVNTGNMVTQTRCSAISKDYGVEVDFRTDIKTDAECRFAKMGDEKGACVFATENRRTCNFITRGECDAMDNEGFYAGYLCSDETLVNVDCGPSRETTCVEGKDQVYFVDTCGNLANIYDMSRIDDKVYWSKVIPVSDSCNYGVGNKNSKDCGNCDSFAPEGSTCREYSRGETAVPDAGDYICKGMGCSFDTNGDGEISSDEHYNHGDAWCAELSGIDIITQDPPNSGIYSPEQEYTKVNLPGSGYAVLKCFDSEVTIEQCDEGRQKVCVESDINGYKNAICKLNRWQTCVDQLNEEDCTDVNQRDCYWTEDLPSYIFVSNIPEDFPKSDIEPGYCSPIFQPGFDFWDNSANAEAICSIGNAVCQYEITKKVGYPAKVEFKGEGMPGCVDNHGKIQQSWLDEMKLRCERLGDCGEKENYQGDEGDKRTIWKKIFRLGKGDEKEEEGTN